MKYEYLIHSLMFGELADMADVNRRLAELGDKGWLLSAVTPDGAPTRRDPAAIGRDLIDGYVSERAAREDYGIADPTALRAAAAGEDGL